MSSRKVVVAVVLLLATGSLVWGAARPVRPSTFELSINGETFQVEADRQQVLTSRKSPAVKYTVALRLSPKQRLALMSLTLDYDRGFAVELDDADQLPTATLNHELGFSVVVTDLGGLSAEQRASYQAKLVEAMRESLARSAVGEVEQSPAEETEAARARGQVVLLRAQDRAGLSRACGIYLLEVGETWVSVVVQMLDDDAEDAQPLVETLLDSLQAKSK